jgi:hypothetical protein
MQGNAAAALFRANHFAREFFRFPLERRGTASCPVCIATNRLTMRRQVTSAIPLTTTV